jgi:hypothetical protein
MISFDAAHKAVHYPADRRFRIWIRPSLILWLVVPILLLLTIAWVQASIFGLPLIAGSPNITEATATSPYGFPVWIRYAQFFNFLYILMTTVRLGRSGFVLLHSKSLPIAFGLRKMMHDISLQSSVYPVIGTPWESRDRGISSMCMDSSSRVWALCRCCSLQINGNESYRLPG